MTYNYVKRGWDKIKYDLDKIIDLYTFIEVQQILRDNDYYKTLYGRAKNRTLIKNNPKLYNSLYKHTEILEIAMKKQHTYYGSYSFAKRIKFIVEYNGILENLKCSCGKKYTFNKYCRYCPDCKRTQLGKPHTLITKRKMRESTIKYIAKAKGRCSPRYNINSISIIDEYGRKHGYNFQHAENGGEVQVIGYFLDGYDEEKNVAIEIDEKRHFKNGMLKEKDIIRQQEIEQYLGCNFIRVTI